MTDIARLVFDDRDIGLHVHMTDYARRMDEYDPQEFIRVMRTMAESLRSYADRLDTFCETRLGQDRP